MAKKSKSSSPFEGRWRITSMEMWGQDFVDAEVEGCFEFGPKGRGSFQFGYVRGDIDYRDRTKDGKPSVEWSWDGNDEMDPASGRGWVVIEGDEIHGVIATHHGDESRFVAKRAKGKKGKKKQIRPVGNAKKAKLIANQSVALADYAAKAYIAADELRIKAKLVKQFPLDDGERATLAEVSALPANLEEKLAKKSALTVVDVISFVMAISESFVNADPKQQLVLVVISKKLITCLQANIVMPDKAVKGKKSKPTDTVYQFKITLLGAKPPIWRRIQVKNCTLDKLHEHIQTAMGWTNSHLHDFKVGEQRYGDPMLMKEDFDQGGYKDSTTTKTSAILPKTGKRFRFVYEYDFGDCWEHEIVFEGCPKPEVGRQYPICLEGERACPPEDVGGVGGYADFLEAIRDKTHEERAAMFEWVDGWFDPDEFDPITATKSMKKGLPDWRRMI